MTSVLPRGRRRRLLRPCFTPAPLSPSVTVLFPSSKVMSYEGTKTIFAARNAMLPLFPLTPRCTDPTSATSHNSHLVDLFFFLLSRRGYSSIAPSSSAACTSVRARGVSKTTLGGRLSAWINSRPGVFVIALAQGEQPPHGRRRRRRRPRLGRWRRRVCCCCRQHGGRRVDSDSGSSFVPAAPSRERGYEDTTLLCLKGPCNTFFSSTLSLNPKRFQNVVNQYTQHLEYGVTEYLSLK